MSIRRKAVTGHIPTPRLHPRGGGGGGGGKAFFSIKVVVEESLHERGGGGGGERFNQRSEEANSIRVLENPPPPHPPPPPTTLPRDSTRALALIQNGHPLAHMVGTRSGAAQGYRFRCSLRGLPPSVEVLEYHLYHVPLPPPTLAFRVSGLKFRG